MIWSSKQAIMIGVFLSHAARRCDFIRHELCATLILIQCALVMAFLLTEESRPMARLRTFYKPLTPSLCEPPYTGIAMEKNKPQRHSKVARYERGDVEQ
jgi:hypothetical protein